MWAVHKRRTHFFRLFWPPVCHTLKDPLRKDVPKHIPPTLIFFLFLSASVIKQKLRPLGQKRLKILTCACGHPNGLCTSFPCCQTLSHISLPPPPPPDVVYGCPCKYMITSKLLNSQGMFKRHMETYLIQAIYHYSFQLSSNVMKNFAKSLRNWFVLNYWLFSFSEKSALF